MKIISFDVGIKNMAYCIFEIDSDTTEPKIVDWNVWNLCAPYGAPSPTHTCTQCMKNKKICGKPAKYTQTKKSVIPIETPIQEYSCGKHAKTHFLWKIPQKEHSLQYLKKQSMDHIKELRSKYIANTSDTKLPKKMEMVEELVTHFQSQCWKPIDGTSTIGGKGKKKVPNAGTIDLICIGRALDEKLRQNPYITKESIQYVVIENQISPIANRMKTIQGMLAQYFISLGVSHIEFVSSSNKLKEFAEVSTANSAYQKHKKDGVYYCRQILDQPSVMEEENGKWKRFFEEYGVKKDDLADCFLQGLWWWKTKKNYIMMRTT